VKFYELAPGEEVSKVTGGRDSRIHDQVSRVVAVTRRRAWRAYSRFRPDPVAAFSVMYYFLSARQSLVIRRKADGAPARDGLVVLTFSPVRIDLDVIPVCSRQR